MARKPIPRRKRWFPETPEDLRGFPVWIVKVTTADGECAITVCADKATALEVIAEIIEIASSTAFTRDPEVLDEIRKLLKESDFLGAARLFRDTTGDAISWNEQEIT